MPPSPKTQGGPFTTKALRAASQLGRTVERVLQDSELTPPGYRLLAYLVSSETAAKVLAAKLAVSRPTVTATLDWLEPRGYVTRTSDQVDRRRVQIVITSKGLQALESTDRLLAARLHGVTAEFNEARIAAIVSALEDLDDALNGYRTHHLDVAGEQVRDSAT